MLTSSMSSIIGSSGWGVNLLHFSNGLNDVCQDLPVDVSFPHLFASCCSNCTDACCAQKTQSLTGSSGEEKKQTSKQKKNPNDNKTTHQNTTKQESSGN